jgi:hypothetical protein
MHVTFLLKRAGHLEGGDEGVLKEIVSGHTLQRDLHHHSESPQTDAAHVEELRIAFSGDLQRSLPRRDQLEGHHLLIHRRQPRARPVRAHLRPPAPLRLHVCVGACVRGDKDGGGGGARGAAIPLKVE